MSEYRLVMKGVVKTFPGVKALDHAQLELRPGKVMALMGENGAGKSTLMKCMFGIYKMDEGEIEYEGEKVNIPTPLDALNRGIAMVHQELQPIPARTVAENIWLGRYPTKKAGPITIVDHAKMYKDTDELLKKLKLDIKSHAKLGSLSIAQMQMVEIAKAVSANCKVLILDEPTSSLTANEVESLFRIMNELKEQGVALVYISHKMDEIKVIADEVTIMRDGQWIATKPAKDLTMNEIIKLMVGRELTNRFPPKDNKPGEVILEVEHLAGKYTRLKDASFQLRKGEVLGIAGLDGSGRTEVLENLFGAMTKESGTIRLHGKEIKNKDLAGIAMTYGYVYVAQIAMGADFNQTVKAITEAEAYPGPSLIIAYAPCINHGIKKGMSKAQTEEELAVKCGYWHNFRFNPAAENKFSLDSKTPDMENYMDFLNGEVRYNSLQRQNPEKAARLFAKNESEAQARYEYLQKLITLYGADKKED